MRTINEIVVHTLAVKPGWMKGRSNEEKLAEVDRWHREDNNWRMIGYHAVIFRDGEILQGRQDWEVGAHEPKVNKFSLGVALEGGFGGNENDSFDKHYTLEQEVALRRYLKQKQEQYPIKKISGHNEYAAKACPCFNVPRWLKNEPPRKITQSTTIGASVGGAAATVTAGATAIGSLEGTSQLVAVVAVCVALAAFAWIARERIQKWARGVQ